MRYSTLVLSLCSLLFLGCSKDSLRVAFEMTYPQNRFTVPAGLNNLESHYTFFYDVPTNKNFFFGDVADEDILEITPAAARIRADQSLGDFSFAEEVVVRICEDNQVNISNVLEKCRREIFYRDNIPLNTGRQIELIPNGNNLKEALTQDEFTVVLVFLRMRTFTSISTPSNFEMIFEAKRE
ncbi:MAG: hypothetical protein AAFO82_07320 [Bacteroidota bacterium]